MRLQDIIGLSGRKLAVISLLYFAEGVPFGLINNALSVYFRSNQMSLENIGLLSLVGLAWSLKLLWAPLVDRFGKRHYWMVPAQMTIGLAVLALRQINPAQPGIFLWAVMGVMALAAATQDIAIDAYTIDILDEGELGVANGIRSGAYRVALILSGGGVVALSAFIGWDGAFVGLFILMVAIAGVVFFWPGCHQEREGAHPAGQSGVIDSWILPIRDILKRPHFFALVLFILLFKVGDAMMGPMISPFWVDRGFTRIEIGLISGTLAPIASIVGSIMGGWLTTLWGIGRAIWALGALQAVSNLGYAYAALATGSKFAVYGASLAESFTGGLGTAAFLAFLMRLCDKRFSATHYAFFSTIFSFSRVIAGALSGFGAAHLGYAPFFLLTFFAACPAFFLLPWVLPMVQQSEKYRNR
ncbi:MAG: MFS transporter [Thermodesulfobacteriota bacterium]